MRILLMGILSTFLWSQTCLADADLWKITAYCACKKCCGSNAEGITASGKKVNYGMVTCNWLPFGTMINIKGIGIFTVEDRGAKSLFGDKNNPIKHIDIYLPTHVKAKAFGVRWKEVQIIEKK